MLRFCVVCFCVCEAHGFPLDYFRLRITSTSAHLEALLVLCGVGVTKSSIFVRNIRRCDDDQCSCLCVRLIWQCVHLSVNVQRATSLQRSSCSTKRYKGAALYHWLHCSWSPAVHCDISSLLCNMSEASLFCILGTMNYVKCNECVPQ